MPFTSKQVLTREDREAIADLREEARLAKKARTAKPSAEEQLQLKYDRADKKEQAKLQKKQAWADRREAARQQRLDAAKAKHQKVMDALTHPKANPVPKPDHALLHPYDTEDDDKDVVITKADPVPCPDDIETESE